MAGTSPGAVSGLWVGEHIPGSAKVLGWACPGAHGLAGAHCGWRGEKGRGGLGNEAGDWAWGLSTEPE